MTRKKSDNSQPWNVRCWNCGWTGVRYASECNCGELSCTPGIPGFQCASSIIQPCRKCGPDVYSSRTEMIRHTSILAVAPVNTKIKR